MNDPLEQPSTEAQSEPMPDLSPLPLSALQQPRRKAFRWRARWIVPALLLSGGLLVCAIWALDWGNFNPTSSPRRSPVGDSQPYDWEILHLPHVTVEVQGLS